MCPASPGLGAWIERTLAEARATIPTDPRPLHERLPPGLPAACSTALGRPFTPDPALVRAAINHAAMRSMMRSILQSTLLEFGKEMWSALPDTRRIPGAGFRSRLMDMAKGVGIVVLRLRNRGAQGPVRCRSHAPSKRRRAASSSTSVRPRGLLALRC